MRIPSVALAVGSLALVAAATPLALAHGESQAHHNSCARKFDDAQRQDMESFRDYDREAFVDVHHPDAVSVFAAGVVAVGLDEVMELLDSHFEAKVGKWSWTEVTREVHGCKTGFIVYRTHIERPGLSRWALNTVTYTYEHGRWLVVSDQGTAIEPPAPETNG